MKGLNQKATGLAQFLDSRGYSGAGDTVMKMAGTINRLEAENAALREQLAAEKKRADAVIEDIRRIAPCSLCKHNGKQSCKNEDVGHEKCFEWRGGQGTEGER